MYRLTAKRETVDGRNVTVYGIYYNSEYSFSDISTDEEAVKRLADDCNKYSLDPIHLRDVVEDFLV